MQDGKTSHTTDIREDYLGEQFGHHFIQKDCWPLNSPDCNPLDYFLGGMQSSVRFMKVNKLYSRTLLN